MGEAELERIQKKISGIEAGLVALHSEFIDKMYPEFGLPIRPASTQVYVYPYGKNRGEITINNEIIVYLDNNESQEDANATLLHESGHYLHALGNPKIKEKDLAEGGNGLSHLLVELVAELSAIQFLERTARTYPSTQVNYFKAAFDMHNIGKLLPLRDLSSKCAEEVAEIIREYQRRLL
ncbi:hypothetical protein J4462_04350 [Candidatus Pacearchaeota archaeon]|nr:hypothetical protein [Candidatus Pacearchaeota archaeon]